MERNLLAELYINRDNDKVVNFNKPYDKLVSHKRSDIRPFNHIGGIRPYVQSEQTRTTAMDFNAEMDERNVDKETKESFYVNTIKQNKDEINYLKRQNKVDHIKKIDLEVNGSREVIAELQQVISNKEDHIKKNRSGNQW